MPKVLLEPIQSNAAPTFKTEGAADNQPQEWTEAIVNGLLAHGGLLIVAEAHNHKVQNLRIECELSRQKWFQIKAKLDKITKITNK